MFGFQTLCRTLCSTEKCSENKLLFTHLVSGGGVQGETFHWRFQVHHYFLEPTEKIPGRTFIKVSTRKQNWFTYGDKSMNPVKVCLLP